MQNETTKKITTGLIVLVLLLVVVYVFGSPNFFGRFGIGSRSAEIVSEVVREMFQDISIGSLSGTIAGVSGSVLTLEVPVLAGVRIPEDADMFLRSITIGGDTKIVEQTWKSEEARIEEMAIYREEGGIPPSPYDMRTLTLADLKVGDRIAVSVGGGNIVDMLEIVPAEIKRTNQ